MRLYLASASPRRREALAALGFVFEVKAAEVDETPRVGEGPIEHCVRVARAKCLAVDAPPDVVVLGADTSVFLGQRIFGKPTDATQALEMLECLAGRTHEVVTAVCLARNGAVVEQERVQTSVMMAEVPRSVLERYVATGEPLDKAGAYALQGLGQALVRRIEGSVGAVVGLPLYETRALLQRVGVEPA